MDGTPFGRYRLVELLGRGGMGEVWRAYDTAIDRVVALKLLPANFADDRVFQERFRREAKAAAGLDEPHVVPIHDFGEIEGRLYVTMRLIKGRDLQTVLAEGPLAPERAVRIIEQVAQAVHAAHKVGLVHRDIKPSNILLDHNDFAYLIDFGIARAAGETGLTSTGGVIGTLRYMAPERFSTGQADARSDIYALACVLYECLTGSAPFPGDSLEQQLAGHLAAPPPRPSDTGLPPGFDAVIANGMAKKPEQRYATTIELAHAARDATTVPFFPGGQLTAAPIHFQDTQLAATSPARGLQPPMPPPPWAQPSPKPPSWRRPRVVVPALLAIVLLIAGGIFAAVKALKPRDQPTAAAPPPTAVPNTGPFTGTYRADLGPVTDLEGKPVAGATPLTVTWGVRSACSSTGCVATAKYLGSATPGAPPPLTPTLAFDDVGGRWLAVGLGSDHCDNAAAEFWGVYTLQPRPDGTLFGDYIRNATNGCGAKRAVTFTRTGDVDINSLPDPASLPARVVSPAEALHGRYHQTVTYTSGEKHELDMAVGTDCLRTGDRCMSDFHNPERTVPMVFGSGKWIYDIEFDDQCPQRGGTRHVKVTTVYPLPAPPQDPITLLIGHGHLEQTGTCAGSGDFEEKYVRTGD